ncbi:hypothetical protein CCUS01_17019 [Colletotrichum cuscutae]|uniref:Uncharacterized protein n=1 Tax=Colletotrichum cuscutae TaxID=1209917 RepID=A0AAI9V780_9PEZI|nr:hypothetical protein CCUS01_17019 [Colletotrichum cuscutae]
MELNSALCMPNQLGEAYIQSAGWSARAGGRGLSCLIRASRSKYLDSSRSIFIDSMIFHPGKERRDGGNALRKRGVAFVVGYRKCLERAYHETNQGIPPRSHIDTNVNPARSPAVASRLALHYFRLRRRCDVLRRGAIDVVGGSYWSRHLRTVEDAVGFEEVELLRPGVRFLTPSSGIMRGSYCYGAGSSGLMKAHAVFAPPRYEAPEATTTVLYEKYRKMTMGR